MGTPKFPLDVSENIARCLYLDEPTNFAALENLSLADRHFRQAGQRYIFRRLVIDAGCLDLDGLLSTLAQNRQLANYVHELYIRELDLSSPHTMLDGRRAGMKPRARGEKWLPAILQALHASPITHLRLDVDEMGAHFGHDETPVLSMILRNLKDMPFLDNLRHFQLREGVDVDLGLLRNAPLLRSLELHDTSLDTDVSDLTETCTPGYSPHPLERLVVLGLGNGYYHSNWDSHQKLFDMGSLRFFAINCDTDNNCEYVLKSIIPVSVNCLTKLVLQIWNYEVLSNMNILQGCKVLVDLILWFHDCVAQIEANDEEDDEGEILMSSFHPPISIQTLQFAFTWEDGILDALKDWFYEHFPELDQNIAGNYDVLWPNLRSIGFRFVWDQDNEASLRPFPLRAHHFKKVASKGVSVGVLQHAGESAMLK